MTGDGWSVGGIRVLFHRRLETADTFPDSFAELGKLLRSKDEQSNSKDYQQMRGLQQSFEHEIPINQIKVHNIEVRESDGAASAIGEQRPLSLGLSAKSYRGTISSFSAGMVWIAFLSSFKCEKTISGGSRLIHWLREKSKTSLALNSSRNTRSVSPVFST